MPTFKNGDISLYYEEQGSGEPLILLHGLTMNHLHFSVDMARLRRHFHVIAMDARGHGKSDKPEAYTIDDHIGDVLALMDHLELDKTDLVGVSMGSYIAQGVAIRVPERVDRLILVSTKSHGTTSSSQALFERHAEELEGLDFQEKMNAASKYMFRNLLEVADTMQNEDLNVRLTREQQKAANEALNGFDFRPELRKIQAKTLVIAGSHDGLNPPKDGRETAALIPDAVFMEFRESGHLPNIEEPRLFYSVVKEFLDDDGGNPPKGW
ncbi:esterase [Bhargavaea cecembensis]|uniref:Esterase n=1 Tax=Bhargavaea cecembensis TaxID=394098 RepID=A0A161RGX5_9BACL|nr:alpha/beta hydrolase [Bhargavaea cecembensis]KZE37278.1 esterase [Bhargavaea cecembensis]